MYSSINTLWYVVLLLWRRNNTSFPHPSPIKMSDIRKLLLINIKMLLFNASISIFEKDYTYWRWTISIYYRKNEYCFNVWSTDIVYCMKTCVTSAGHIIIHCWGRNMLFFMYDEKTVLADTSYQHVYSVGLNCLLPLHWPNRRLLYRSNDIFYQKQEQIFYLDLVYMW